MFNNSLAAAKTLNNFAMDTTEAQEMDMRIQDLIGVVCASAALAACGGGGGGGSTAAVPTTVTVPGWVTLGAATPAISANSVGGTSSTDVTITFNADGSIAFDLAGDSFSVTNADIIDSVSDPDGDGFLFEANAAANGGSPDYVELVILDDPAEDDIVALARIDRFNTPLGYETAAVIGNTTDPASLPSGTASYSGFMVGSLTIDGELPDFDNDGNLDVEYDTVTAAAAVAVDFDATTVDVAFSDFEVADPSGGMPIALTGSSLTSNALIGGGTSQYGGAISGDIVANGTTYGVSGGLAGGFFGAGAEATAGAFAANELGGNAAFVGNFAAN